MHLLAAKPLLDSQYCMNVTLITPTFDCDYERFVFQRESMERSGTDLPHVAIVDTEDLPKFKDMPFQRNLTLIPSEQVLGKSMDRRRTVWGISRRDYRYWITGRGVHGWLAQQLMKLAAASVVKTDAMACLDSDTFFVDRVTSQDFVTEDGRVHLYETTDDLDVEMSEWYAHSLRFFGLKEAGITPRRFTHSPVPMHCGVVRDMLSHIEKRHQCSWMDAMVNGDRLMEYTTYGTFARHVDECRRVCPVAPALTLYYWWKSDAQDLEVKFASRLAESQAKMVLVNGNIGLGIDRYRHLAQASWSRATRKERPAVTNMERLRT